MPAFEQSGNINVTDMTAYPQPVYFVNNYDQTGGVTQEEANNPTGYENLNI